MRIPECPEGTSKTLDAALPVRSAGGVGPIVANPHMRFSVPWVSDTELQAHQAMSMRDTGYVQYQIGELICEITHYA